MDRAYIGSVVFGDKAKKAQLEAILFPLIHAGIDGEIKKSKKIKKILSFSLTCPCFMR